MLKDGQLVWVVANVVKQLLNKASLDLLATDLDRSLDGQAALVAVQPRDEVFTLIDGLGQTTKLRAVPEKIGPHGDSHKDRLTGLLGCLEQEADEVSGLLRVLSAAGAESKNFLKLVDYDQQVILLFERAL